MKKTSTNCIIKKEVMADEDPLEQIKKGPKQQTIDFLKQFARSYHVEPALVGTKLCGFMLN